MDNIDFLDRLRLFRSAYMKQRYPNQSVFGVKTDSEARVDLLAFDI